MRTGSRIVRVPAPFTRCYAVRGEGLVVVDVGPPRSAERVRRAFAAAGLDPTDTDLIVLTHGHWDHVGAAEVTRELTGAPIAMHVREAERLGRRGTPIPPGVGGWGRILSAMARRLPVPPLAPFEIGLEIRDEVLPLEPFGVGGRVVPTPGHSPGSVSVVLDSGEALVGDLAMNRLPLRWGPGFPTLADDARRVRESWRRLLALGVTTVYPGHGRPFPAEVLRQPGAGAGG